MASGYDICGLSPADIKTIDKYRRRVSREADNNTKSEDFEFARNGFQYFYFRIVLKSEPYAGQVHIIEQKLVYGGPPDVYIYPVNGPKCTFLTPIWHANISTGGSICLDVLKDNWSITMFTAAAVKAIELLIANPNIESPNNKEAANMMVSDIAAFNKKVASYYNYGAASSAVKDLFITK